MEKLFALLPLLYALFVTVKTGDKALRGGPMSDEDKESMREVGKGLAYLAAAAVLVWFFTPDFGLGLTILWTLLTAVFAVLGILCVIELKDTPKRKMLHNRLWKDGRKTPLYSMSGEPVQHVRWARRFMLAAMILIAIICGVYSALSTSSSASADEGSKETAQPAASAPADTSTSAPPATAPATAAPATFKNECGGIDPIKVTDPKATIEFKTGLDKTGKPHTFICHDGKWKQWSEVSSTAAPANPPLTYWSVDPAKNTQGYGVVVINNTSYLFWVTSLKW